MIDRRIDVYSLSDFQRNTKEHIQRLKESGYPEALAVNGKIEIIVQSAEAYERLLETLERLETIEKIRQGLKSMKEGKGRLAEEVFRDLEAINGIRNGVNDVKEGTTYKAEDVHDELSRML